MNKFEKGFTDLRRYKQYDAGSYHHVTAHAIGRELLFKDDLDSALFLKLLGARLSPEIVRDRYRRPIRNFAGEIELVSFCLMRNHLHLLLKQIKERAMATFMESILTSYAMRFNNRHQRTGQLLISPYKATMIEDHTRLRDVVQYIHLNPFRKGIDPFTYRYSSHRYYAGLARVDWCNSGEGVNYFGDRGGYLRRLHDATAAPTSEAFDEISGNRRRRA